MDNTSFNLSDVTADRPKTVRFKNAKETGGELIHMKVSISGQSDPAHDVPLYDVQWIKRIHKIDAWDGTEDDASPNEDTRYENEYYRLSEVHNETWMPIRQVYELTGAETPLEDADSIEGLTAEMVRHLAQATTLWANTREIHERRTHLSATFYRALETERLYRDAHQAPGEDGASDTPAPSGQ